MRSLKLSVTLATAALGLSLSACGNESEDVSLPTTIAFDGVEETMDIDVSTATSSPVSLEPSAPTEETETGVDTPACSWRAEEHGNWAELSYGMDLPDDAEFRYFEARVTAPDAEQSYPVTSAYMEQDLNFTQEGPYEVQTWMFTVGPQGGQWFICTASQSVNDEETRTLKSD